MDTYFITWFTGFVIFAVNGIAFLVLAMVSHVIYLRSKKIGSYYERESESERAGKVFGHSLVYGIISILFLCTAFAEYSAPWSQKPFLECFWFAGNVTYLLLGISIALGVFAALWIAVAKLIARIF